MNAVLKLDKKEPKNFFKFKNWLDPETADLVRKEFENFNLTQCFGYTDRLFEFQKYTCPDRSLFPPTIRQVIDDLMSEQTVRYLEGLTGIEGLKTDPGLWGAGMHITLPLGYLAMHRDFNVLPTTYLKPKQYLRVLNVIGYFSPADISLGFKAEQVYPNQWLVFNPSEMYHGHPHPYKQGIARYSIAVYYYVEAQVPKSEWRSTEYLKLNWIEDTPEYQKKRRDRADINLRYSQFIGASLDEEILKNPVINLAKEMINKVEMGQNND